ncbi:hypothetical protein LWI29_030248 [Acer saccharum]|uniref:Protein kinase domain-containing protein n=1 Tax=Acer saccharum TaxID=4024 RepID=A0AA39SH74_ACESA|nr:hypothetical protein LWI29_030248 [Acer saccharum]
MAMEILNLLIFAFLGVVALTVLVPAQTQLGFISIDCGLPENSAYTDKKTGINYTSDVTFTDTGVSYNISSEYNRDTLEQPFLTVRSFPEGMKNCYTLKPAVGYIKFLIRASFMYGNYDGQSKLPSFDLLLGADVWDSVELSDASTIVSKEIIHVPPTNYVDVCLGNKGSGTPFISSLELRPLVNSSYPSNLGTSLLLYSRLDVGSTAEDNETYRFKDDAYDRIWSAYTRSNWVTISSPLKMVRSTVTNYQPPSAVMQTAAMPANGSNSLVFDLKFSDSTLQFFAYLHFAELDDSQAKNQTREMNTYMNGEWWDGPTTLNYLSPYTVYGDRPIIGGEKLEISINKTEESPLSPILNALELYQLKQFLQLLSNQEDVDAILNIKTKYGVKRNWQGDPCAPMKYLWQGLNCSYPEYTSPRITSLNLSSSGISGEISSYISDLKLIQSLDLSNNNLTGPVPDFLSQLPFLTVLNLRGNNLQGSIPAGLIEKRKNDLLSLSVDGNPDLCLSASCTKEKNVVVPVLASIVAVSVLVAASSILWILKTRKEGTTWNNENNRQLQLKNRRFLYSEVVRITDNFERIIGRGGFGTVYHGNLDDIQVAVKMLSPSSVQGYKQFQAEVELLMRVHHKNLTTLVGYCDDGTHMGLIYEFMANGNLESHLLDEESSTTADVLSWEGRLRIATDTAQGLEYLHSGCKPPIIHRDVKPTNILLSEKFHAKIADFGLSRIFPVETGTHISTVIAGTPGYLDPEYYTSNRLTEKSDVYSFGVVLLQMIASKPAIEKSIDRTHIIQWVSFMLAKGDIKNVVDPKLQGNFSMNSVRKAIEVAMACVSQTSAKRPTMKQVVFDLNESLAIEMDRTMVGHEIESKDSIESSSLNLRSDQLPPLAR